jgi:hypothetical protein
VGAAGVGDLPDQPRAQTNIPYTCVRASMDVTTALSELCRAVRFESRPATVAPASRRRRLLGIGPAILGELHDR